MKYLLSIVLLITIQSSAQVEADSILIEGHYRTFHYLKPAEQTKGFSLVFVLHGSGGSGQQMMQRVNSYNQIRNQEKMLVVYPSGYRNYWNECRKMAPSAANLEQINEEAFFIAMINHFRKLYHIDKERVFVVGTSGGGHMAFKLGLTIPDRFRAITALIANLPEEDNLDCPQQKKAMNVMIVNGTADKTNPYEGGDVILGSGNFGKVRSTEKTLQYWAELAGYGGDPVKTILPDTNPNDGKTIEQYSFQGKSKQVILLKVLGGKHDYPGDIDVHLQAWNFFKSTF